MSTIRAPTYCLAQHLADLLGGDIGSSPHHVKNSMEFINTVNILLAGP
jgi:hypothetical protein